MFSVRNLISTLSPNPRPFPVEGFGMIDVSCHDASRSKWIRIDLNGIKGGQLFGVAKLMMDIYLTNVELYRNFELVGCNRGPNAWKTLFRYFHHHDLRTHSKHPLETNSISLRVTENLENKEKLESIIDEWEGSLEGRVYVAFQWPVETVAKAPPLTPVIAPPRSVERVVTLTPPPPEQEIVLLPKSMALEHQLVTASTSNMDFDHTESLIKIEYDVIRGPVRVRGKLPSKPRIRVEHIEIDSQDSIEVREKLPPKPGVKVRHVAFAIDEVQEKIKHGVNGASIDVREVLSSTPSVQVEQIDFEFNGARHKSKHGDYKGSVEMHETLGPLRHCSLIPSDGLVIGQVPLDGFMQKLAEMGVEAFTFLALNATELQEVDDFLGRFFQKSKVSFVALTQCTIFGEALSKIAATHNDFLEHLAISDSISEWMSHLPGLARSCKKLKTFVGKDSHDVSSMEFLNKIMAERTSLTRLEMMQLNIPIEVLIEWLTHWAFDDPALSKDAKGTLTIVLGADVARIDSDNLELLHPLIVAFNEKMKGRLVHLNFNLFKGDIT